jgi:hypothetical protein
MMPAAQSKERSSRLSRALVAQKRADLVEAINFFSIGSIDRDKLELAESAYGDAISRVQESAEIAAIMKALFDEGNGAPVRIVENDFIGDRDPWLFVYHHLRNEIFGNIDLVLMINKAFVAYKLGTGAKVCFKVFCGEFFRGMAPESAPDLKEMMEKHYLG